MANIVPFNNANPSAKLCRLSNAVFTTAVQHRLLLPIGYTWVFCRCNRDVGPFFFNCYRCPENGVRNQIRNALHRELKARFTDILKVCIATANLNRRVLEIGELLQSYYPSYSRPFRSSTS